MLPVRLKRDLCAWEGAVQSLLVALLTSVYVSTPSGCLACTEDAVKQCAKPLEPYDFKRYQEVFPYFSDESLDIICRHYAEMEECLRDVRVHCNRAVRSEFEGLEAATRYLCEDGREVYRQQRHCYVGAAVSEMAQVCYQSYNKKLITIANTNKNAHVKEKKKKICRSMEDHVKCVSDGVRRLCDKEAGDWLYRIETKRLEPTYEEMKCFKGEKLGIPAIFGIMLAIFTIVMSVILTIVVCQRRRGTRHSSLRAIKPRPKQTPKKKKKDDKAAHKKGQAGEALVLDYSKAASDNANGPLQKVDSSVVVDNELSCVTSTVPMNTTITELDTDCTTTYIAPDVH